jgi:uncharacterized protein with HEPN domain
MIMYITDDEGALWLRISLSLWIIRRSLVEPLKGKQPQIMEIAKRHGDWRALSGFRNVLVHDYLGVDLELVYQATQEQIPN